MPTLAREDPQVWYTQRPVTRRVQQGRLRDRGLRGGDPSLAFFEWSVDPLRYDPLDPVCWAQANPGLGKRITRDYIELEQAALNPDAFARERLSVGDYPVDGGAWETIRAEAWAACSG
jgi:hypothetical protein